MKKRRVLLLVHEDFVPPQSLKGLSEKEIAPFKTEYDVSVALEELGHEVKTLGVSDEIAAIRNAVRAFKPHIVFNLLEEFRGEGVYVPYVLGFLELTGQAYTGCNPRGLIVADNKGLFKKILRYHRILVPDFAVFPRRRAVKRPPRLSFPLIVKSATEHGSVGISQASVVQSDDKLAERITYMHEQMQTDAVVEQFIEGREFYVGVMGNERLRALPIWELLFDNLAEGAANIATEKVKWDLNYRKKIGLKTRTAQDLPDGAEERILRLCKRVYHILGLSGYARMDIRLTPDGRIYLLEPNPNPDLALDEDFSESAGSIGIDYRELIQRVISLGLRYHAR